MANVDHRTMLPPSLALTSRRPHRRDSDVSVWDLRIAQPNVSSLPTAWIHSLEHFLGSILPRLSPGVVVVAPMGCLTGFYIVTLGIAGAAELESLLAAAFEEVLTATEVPLANTLECGWAQNHSLDGAQSVSSWMLSRRSDWPTRTMQGDVPSRSDSVAKGD